MRADRISNQDICDELCRYNINEIMKDHKQNIERACWKDERETSSLKKKKRAIER